MPYWRPPRSASPESFRRTRWYLGFVWIAIGGMLVGRFAVRFAELESLEAPHPHVLSSRRRKRRDQLAHRLRRVADVGLAEELLDVLRVHSGDLHREPPRPIPQLPVACAEIRLARQTHPF